MFVCGLFQDAASGEKRHELCGHNHRVVSCHVDEAQKRWASCWETHTTLYTQFPCLVCSYRLLSASWDKSVICWDMNSSEQIVSSCRRCRGSVRSWMLSLACAKFVVYKISRTILDAILHHLNND